MDHEFLVGDLVECIVDHGPIEVGDTGEVLRIGGVGIAVRWDQYDATLHDCGGLCENGHGWWISPSRLSLIDSADYSLPDMDVAPLL